MTYELQFIMKGSGFFVNETAGQALGLHKLVYRGADSLWYLADADAAVSMPVLGITMSPITATRRGRILRQGYIGDISWTWTPGGELYASTTAGELTQTAPAGVGDIVQVVGVAVSATIIYFNSDLGNRGVAGVGGALLLPDYTVFANAGAPYAVDDQGTIVVGPIADAKTVYDFCRAALEPGGGWIHFKGGLYNFSDPIYLQSEGGGGIPDYPSYCKMTGNGADHASEANATVFHFNAGEDGVIIDMHTNNGGWSTGSTIKDLTIRGTFGDEMDSAIIFMKTAYAFIENVRIYYMGSGGHGCEFINCQFLFVNRLRTDSHIPNMSSIYVANIDGAAQGYLEQGAHQTWRRCTGSVGSGGASSAGCRGWEFDIPSGTANLSNLVFIDCESFGAGAYNTAPRYGWYFHNVAGAFQGVSWRGGNFEGLDHTNGEYCIYVDNNVGLFYGDVFNGTFAGPTTGIQMDHAASRLGIHSCHDPPDRIGGIGQYFWDRTLTPGTIAAGTNNVFAMAGSNVQNWGQASITGAVNLVTVTHNISMSIATNLPRFTFTPLQDLGAGTRTWIDTITTTQFNVNFSNQPGGATWLFDWWGGLEQGF